MTRSPARTFLVLAIFGLGLTVWLGNKIVFAQKAARKSGAGRRGIGSDRMRHSVCDRPVLWHGLLVLAALRC